MAIVLIGTACNKIHYNIRSDSLELNIIDSDVIYELGDTLDIGVELCYKSNDIVQLPIQLPIFDLIKIETFLIIPDEGKYFDNISILNEDPVINLGNFAKDTVTALFINTDFAQTGKFEFKLCLFSTIEFGKRVHKYNVSSRNYITIDIRNSDL